MKEINENYLLSCLLKDDHEGLTNKVLSEGVTKNDFQDPVNRVVFDAICQVCANGNVDLSTVALKLSDNGSLEMAGGFHTLNKLDDLTETTAHFKEYLTSFVNGSKKARLTEHLQQATQRLEQSKSPEIIHEILGEINDLQVQLSKKRTRTMVDVVGDLRSEIQCYIDGTPPPIGMSWGIPSMSKCAGEIEKDELVVIGAAPGRGKTSLAIHLARHNVNLGRRGVYFSLEMTDSHILRNIITQETQVNYKSLGKYGEGDVKKWREHLEKFEKSKDLQIFSDCSYIDQIVNRTHLLYQSGLDFIVVDYVQLVQTNSGRNSKRVDEIGEITRKLKKITLDLNIPVITMAQLNRESTKINKFPSMADFRESASIEQDANKIVFCHRPDKDQSGQSQRPEDNYTGTSFDQQLLQRKARNGRGECNVWVTFSGPTVSFFDKNNF